MCALDTSWSHDDLCLLTAKWVTGTSAERKRNDRYFGGKMQAVVEMARQGECCDVFAFGYWTTHLFEIKISRSDYKRDAKKHWRKHGEGVGRNRWFVVPEGLITSDEVNDGWGLIYVTKKGQLQVVKASEHFESRQHLEELNILRALLRRTGQDQRVFEFGKRADTTEKKSLAIDIQQNLARFTSNQQINNY